MMTEAEVPTHFCETKGVTIMKDIEQQQAVELLTDAAAMLRDVRRNPDPYGSPWQQHEALAKRIEEFLEDFKDFGLLRE
jgi:hypothetical protein